MALTIGEVIESAIWITGDESEELRNRYTHDVTLAIADLCREQGVIHGPIQWLEKAPGSERVPAVPDHIKGSRVRLWVAEATVLEYAPQTSTGSFIANLDQKDLVRLRLLTRRAAKRSLSDADCDQIIESFGPEAAVETLRAAVRH